jgi:membrane protein YqaA with SNARE-associated domain
VSLNFLQTSTSAHAHHSVVPHWLTKLGILGFFGAAIMDASVIPMPVPGTTDLLLLWMVSHRQNPWLLVTVAVVGSLIGGYTTWALGKKGGEAGLKRWVPARMLERIKGWVEKHPLLAVFVPTMLPPPIPLSPFLLAAGALGIPLRRFLLVFGTARILRYGLVALLAVKYGRHVVRLWSATLAQWSTPLMWTFGVIMVAGLGYGIWNLKRKTGETVQQPALEASPSQAD